MKTEKKTVNPAEDKRPDTERVRTEPERTCSACGKKAAKSEFLRFVLSPEGTVACDARMKIQSRGVYLCPNGECIRKAVKRRVFDRFFKTVNTGATLSSLRASVTAGYSSYLYSLMNLAAGSGAVVFGYSAVFKALNEGNVFLVMLARDAGKNIADKAIFECKKNGVELAVVSRKSETANEINRAEVAVIAVRHEGFAARFKRGWRICEEAKTWYNGENKWQ